VKNRPQKGDTRRASAFRIDGAPRTPKKAALFRKRGFWKRYPVRQGAPKQAVR